VNSVNPAAVILVHFRTAVGHPTPLGQAFAEYGRIDKTMHLLSLMDPVDDTYRRRINRQLTVQKSRHRLTG
jgi:TnpA family transposase